MAYVNNGDKRSLTIEITKKIGGVIQLGYPKEYDGRLAFLSFPSLSNTEASRLTNSEFSTRLLAFEAYIESIEAGLDVSTDATNDSIVTDLGACPVPPTTTTTTTVAATTTTTTVPVTTTTTTVAATTTTTTVPVTTTTTTAP